MKRIFLLLFTLALLWGCAAQRAELPSSFLGGPMAQSEAHRTIKILPETRWVNVTGGEVIWFVGSTDAFGWSFDAQTGPRSFDLRRIAPAGFLDRPVTTYVASDPRKGGDDGDRGNQLAIFVTSKSAPLGGFLFSSLEPQEPLVASPVYMLT